MIGTRLPRVPPLSWNVLLLIACLLVPGTRSVAQTPTSAGPALIPPPPKLKGAPGQPDHQAIQSQSEPWLAYDYISNRNLRWLCDKGTWIDTQTDEALGYDGFRAENGEIIPPPPVINDASGQHQATQSMGDPTHAANSKTGQNLSWDARNKTWKDTRTGGSVGFHGWLVRKCGVRDDLEARDRALMNAMAKNYSTRWYLSIDYQWRDFYKWEEVSGNSPSVVSNGVTSFTNGFGAWTGVKLGGFPMYGMVGGYYAAGLETNAMLVNGHRVRNDVKDFGFGAGVRLMASGSRRFTPWASIAALYQANNGAHKEYDKSDVLVFSEDRTHRGFAGEYGLGGTFWVQSMIGLDFGASYNGQFKNVNADENFKLSTGLVLRTGSQ